MTRISLDRVAPGRGGGDLAGAAADEDRVEVLVPDTAVGTRLPSIPARSMPSAAARARTAGEARGFRRSLSLRSCDPGRAGVLARPFSSPETWRLRFAKWRARTPALPGSQGGRGIPPSRSRPVPSRPAPCRRLRPSARPPCPTPARRSRPSPSRSSRRPAGWSSSMVWPDHDMPGDDLRLGDAFADIGEPEGHACPSTSLSFPAPAGCPPRPAAGPGK